MAVKPVRIWPIAYNVRDIMTKRNALNSVRIIKNQYIEKKKKPASFEKFAAESIIMDINDRRGIKHIFGQIYAEDKATYNDIKKTWEYIIKECFKEFQNMILTPERNSAGES